jgi:hypothetical protein
VSPAATRVAIAQDFLQALVLAPYVSQVVSVNFKGQTGDSIIMAIEKAAIIEAVCNAVSRRDEAAAILAAKQYPFALQANAGRGYSVLEATRVFVRDGFVDRYSGGRFVNPAVLRILFNLFPSEFPFSRTGRCLTSSPP